MKRLAVIGLVFLCIGCASYVKYYPYKFNQEAAKGVGRVALAPFNLLSPLPSEVENREGLSAELIKTYLDNKGLRVDSGAEIRTIWREEKAKVGGIYDPNDGHLLKDRLTLCLRNATVRICESRAVDAVAFPAIIMRTATLDGISVYWDGTNQIVQTREGAANLNTDSFSGNASALSLEMILVSRDGRPILRNIAGIEHPYRYVKEGPKGTWQLRKDLLTDKDNLSRAVAMSFHPFIPCVDYPAKATFSQE